MKVCIYGSSSEKTPKVFIDVGYELGLKLALNNHSIIFGGGNDGMMGAVARGVFDNGGKITAISPEWITEFDAPFENYTEKIITDTLDERKNLFLEKSDVFIVLPGGLGTLDEFFGIIALKYLNRHSKKVILFNINHCYDKLIEALQDMNDMDLIREDCLNFFDIANSIDEVLQIL